MNFEQKLQQINKVETSVPDANTNGDDLSNIVKHEVGSAMSGQNKSVEASGCGCRHKNHETAEELCHCTPCDCEAAEELCHCTPCDCEAAEELCHCTPCDCEAAEELCHCTPCDCEAAEEFCDHCHCTPCDCEAAEELCHCTSCDCEMAEEFCDNGASRAVRDEDEEMATDSYYEFGSDEFIQYSDAEYVTPYHNTCNYSMITPDPEMLNNGNSSDNNHIAITTSS